MKIRSCAAERSNVHPTESCEYLPTLNAFGELESIAESMRHNEDLEKAASVCTRKGTEKSFDSELEEVAVKHLSVDAPKAGGKFAKEWCDWNMLTVQIVNPEYVTNVKPAKASASSISQGIDRSISILQRFIWP
jgi:hypothetical protein